MLLQLDQGQHSPSLPEFDTVSDDLHSTADLTGWSPQLISLWCDGLTKNLLVAKNFLGREVK